MCLSLNRWRKQYDSIERSCDEPMKDKEAIYQLQTINKRLWHELTMCYCSLVSKNKSCIYKRCVETGEFPCCDVDDYIFELHSEIDERMDYKYE